MMVQTIERVIQLEEGTDGFVEVPTDLHERLNLPPENQRIKNVQIGLRTTVDGKQGDFIEFHTLPYGLDGCWCVSREFLCM